MNLRNLAHGIKLINQMLKYRSADERLGQELMQQIITRREHPSGLHAVGKDNTLTLPCRSIFDGVNVARNRRQGASSIVEILHARRVRIRNGCDVALIIIAESY